MKLYAERALEPAGQKKEKIKGSRAATQRICVRCAVCVVLAQAHASAALVQQVLQWLEQVQGLRHEQDAHAQL